MTDSNPENSLEVVSEIWHDKDGYHFEVGPDRDGLDLIEIRYYERDDALARNRMTFTVEQAIKLRQALKIALNMNFGPIGDEPK